MHGYSERLLDHFQHPRNAGTLADPDGVATVMNPQCGDTTVFSIKVVGGIITEVRWQTRGCSAAIAASSAASEVVKGMPIQEALALGRQAISTALGGLPPAKTHGSLLAAGAVQGAIADYLSRNSAKASR